MFFHYGYGFPIFGWLIWALILGGLVYLVVRAASRSSSVRGGYRNHDGGWAPPTAPPPPPDDRTGTAAWTVRDPVCGAEGPASQAGARAEYAGKIYHFCSDACRDAFIQEPQRYVGPHPPSSLKP